MDSPTKFREWNEELLIFAKALNLVNYFLGYNKAMEEPKEPRLADYATRDFARNKIDNIIEIIEKIYKGIL